MTAIIGNVARKIPSPANTCHCAWIHVHIYPTSSLVYSLLSGTNPRVRYFLVKMTSTIPGMMDMVPPAAAIPQSTPYPRRMTVTVSCAGSVFAATAVRFTANIISVHENIQMNTATGVPQLMVTISSCGTVRWVQIQ